MLHASLGKRDALLDQHENPPSNANFVHAAKMMGRLLPIRSGVSLPNSKPEMDM
jgi:hypothetical protein